MRDHPAVIVIQDEVVNEFIPCEDGAEAEQVFVERCKAKVPDFGKFSKGDISVLLDNGYVLFDNGSICLSWPTETPASEQKPVDLKRILMELGNRLVTERSFAPASAGPGMCSTYAIDEFTKWLNQATAAQEILGTMGVEWRTVQKMRS